MNTLAAESLNHLLRSASWARDRLALHAGATFKMECAPFAVSLTIREDGAVAPAAADAVPNVTVRVPPPVAFRLAMRDDAAWQAVSVGGDPALAESLGHVFRHLRWDVEEDLSRIFGDIAAHRMARGGQAFDRWARASADHLGRTFAEFWTFEQPLIASRHDVEHFARDVDTLRDDVARLEKRIDRLTRSASPS